MISERYLLFQEEGVQERETFLRQHVETRTLGQQNKRKAAVANGSQVATTDGARLWDAITSKEFSRAGTDDIMALSDSWRFYNGNTAEKGRLRSIVDCFRHGRMPRPRGFVNRPHLD